MPILRYLLASMLVLLTIFSSQAQVMVPTTIRTPYGNVESTRLSMTSGGLPFNGQQSLGGPVRARMTVALVSDSIFNDIILFDYLTDSISSITVPRNDKRGGDYVIYPKDTKLVSQLFNGKNITGVPADSCWLFKMVSGPISSYAEFPTDNSVYFIAIQKGDGPILEMTKENLGEMVGDDPKLLKLIDKGKLVKAVWKYNNSNP